MGDKFTIRVSTGDLSAAETLLNDLSRNIGEEGGKLAALPGKAGSWTGKAATTLKAEMTRIAQQMQKGPEHFTNAKTAVQTFRGRIEDAQTKTLPDLNRRYQESIDTYDGAVRSANSTYGDATRPYRNMPAEDSGTALAEAKQKRDGAISSAATVRDGAQRKLQSEYEALIGDLQAAATTCGSALSAAVLVAVPAEVVSSYLAGGGMGPGTLDANFDKLTRDARQKLTGDDSLAGRADDLKAGTELGDAIKNKIKNGQPLSPEEQEWLKANARNQAFVQGFMESMGPEALAALGHQTLVDANAPDDDQAAAKDLKNTLTDVFTTGSHVVVDDGKGGQRYLMDDGWLDNFNPKDAWPEERPTGGQPLEGFRPDILVPFLTKPLSENFSKVVGDRWLRDYETAKKNGQLQNFYNAYRDMYTGKDVSHIVFDRMGDHAGVANDLMTGHLDTFNHLMTGKDPVLTGHVNDADITKQLNTILKNAVLGIDPNDTQRRSNADYIVAGMGKYLADPANKNPKLIKDVLPALGEIMVSPQYLPGQIMSVATPFAPDFDPKAGFPAYTRDPNLGLLMDPALWQQLQQEALRRPENAASMVQATTQWLEAARRGSEGTAYTLDPDRVGPDGLPLTGPSGQPYSADFNGSVIGLDLYQQEAVRSFLGGNLVAVKDDLTAEMEQRMKDAGKPAEIGTAVVGKIFEWATDPKAIAGDVAGITFGAAVDFAGKQFTEGAEKDIKDQYTKQLDALNKSIDPAFTDPGFWDDTNGAADRLAQNYDPRRTPPSVFTQADQDKGGPVTEYVGDPKKYVGHKSEYVGGGGNPVMDDDFLEYGDDGEVTGVKDPKEMNHLQREAYLNWLHDPAVQNYLDQNIDAVEKARQRAGK